MTIQELDKLTPGKKQSKIAEYLGWKKEKLPFTRHGSTLSSHPRCKIQEAWWHPDIAGCRWSPPDYLSDLNAMHDVEEYLIKKDIRGWLKYTEQLRRICYKTYGFACGEYHATASQRANAFLLTVE